MLFAMNQPLSDAEKLTCDVVLELLESKLDEGLSYLEGENPRRARNEIEIKKEFGSVQAMVKEVLAEKRPTPSFPMLNLESD